jgi:hypothetical protein
MLWLEASPLRDQALAGRTAFTAADVSASQRQEADLPSVLPATISGILPTLNLVQAGASARLRAVIESSRTRITSAGGGPPARTTATDATQTAADDVLQRITGAEQAIDRGRVLLRAAIARMDTWLSAPATPSDVPTRLNELFHTQDPGYGRLLRDRLQVMLTNLEGSGRLVVRLHTAGQTQACTDSNVRGERTMPYEFFMCSISSSLDLNAAVLLHELAHSVIPGRGSRALAEQGFPQDRAYPGERLLLRMTTEEALNNAESYSHFVRVLTGAWARPPVVDTATGCTDAALLLDALALAQSANRRAGSNLLDQRENIVTGRPITQSLRAMIDTQFSTPADSVLLQIIRDFEILAGEGTIWHIPQTFTCVAARDCPAGVLAMDDRRMYRDGGTRARRGRPSNTIRVCPAFFALSSDVRARVAYVMVALAFGDRLLQHPNRIWQYASFALALYQSDFGAPPASSLAEHQSADATPAAPSQSPAAPNRPTTTTPGAPRPNP